MLDEKSIKYTYYYSISNFRKDEKIENDENHTPTLSTLHLTTFHSAKGLEFDTVIIPDFESYKKYFTDFKATSKEQRKALYVALTRARVNLYLIANKEIDFLKDKNSYEIKHQAKFIDDFINDNELPF